MHGQKNDLKSRQEGTLHKPKARRSSTASSRPESATTAPCVPFPGKVRNLVIVLGDQLDARSSALRDVDPAQDVVWMAEVAQESTHVW